MSYLDELVKKSQAEATEEVEEVIEETEEVEETVDEVAEEEIEEEAVEEEAVEEEAVEEESVTVTITAAPAEESKKETEEPEAFITVDGIAIRNVPDMAAPVRAFSGNIIKVQKVAEFTEIKYTKPGFGLVIGYTQDI